MAVAIFWLCGGQCDVLCVGYSRGKHDIARKKSDRQPIFKN